jgi:gluconolactonase
LFTRAAIGQTIPALGGEVEELWVSEHGFSWLEGPAYDGAGSVWFSDLGRVFIPDPTRVLRFDIESLTTETVIGLEEDPQEVAGLAFDGKGQLLATHGVVTRRSVDQLDQFEVLADSFEGVPIAANDLVLDADGGIYFTHFVFPPVPGEDAVFYISPEDVLEKAATGPLTSNGIGISPDNHTLYVLSAFGLNVTAFDINEDHTLSNGRVFTELQNFGDGMTVDRFGNVYVSDLGTTELPEDPLEIIGLPGSMVRVFNPAGEKILSFEPPHGAINMTFGAPDDTLYIAGFNALQRVPITFVPEPGSMALFMVGVFAVLRIRRRR